MPALKLTTYCIAARADGSTWPVQAITRTSVRGYALGQFGCRKERWFYSFTHLPTGLAVTSLNAKCIELKVDALAELERLAAEGLADKLEAEALASSPFGGHGTRLVEML